MTDDALMVPFGFKLELKWLSLVMSFLIIGTGLLLAEPYLMLDVLCTGGLVVELTNWSLSLSIELCLDE